MIDTDAETKNSKGGEIPPSLFSFLFPPHWYSFIDNSAAKAYVRFVLSLSTALAETRPTSVLRALPDSVGNNEKNT